jgi:hypothetical protein
VALFDRVGRLLGGIGRDEIRYEDLPRLDARVERRAHNL